MSLNQIHAAIPHRPPFLLVDEIVEQDEKRILCRKTFHDDEWFFSGHYPQYPLVPGVLLCEAAMQAGAVLLARYTRAADGEVPVAARMEDVRFKRMVRPGESIEMEVELIDHVAKAWYLKARVNCQGQLAARLQFTCTMASQR